MFTDTHCHLLSEYYTNLDEIIDEAQDRKIHRLISSGYDDKSNRETIEIINKYKMIYGTIGIHPQAADEANETWLEYIDKNIQNNKIIAIGEIGLDYHYGKENRGKQIFWFEKQLSYAERKNIPVIIHSRNATEDIINCLKKYKVKGIIHSFSGSLETANIFISMGFLLGINGTVTFKNSNLKTIITEIEKGFIVLETDSPYLTPEPYRGKTNYPKHIKEIAEFVCLIKNISLEELSKATEENIKRIFDI